MYAPKIKEKGLDRQIDFVKDLNPDLPQIVADPSQLQQVFLNLFINAVDAISSLPDPEVQGVIKIQTRVTSENTVEIIISDNGKGIDEELIKEVFKPFFTTKSKGTGLGLAISKRLVEQHNGGNISVESNPEGAGVTFIMSFPVDETINYQEEE